MRAHPAAQLFPMMTDGEIETLARDILNHGQHHPILVVDGGGEWLILDGRNRFEACRRVGVHPKTTVWTGDDPIAAVWSLNGERRHLTESQRAMIGEGFATLKHGGDRKSDSIKAQACALISDAASQIESARLVGVSRRLLQGARRVREKGVPELVAAVQSGAVSVTAAAEVAVLPVEEQRLLVAGGASAVVARANRRDEKPVGPRLVVHNGALSQETRSGVFQQPKQKLYDLSAQPPRWRTHHERHAEVRSLLEKGLRVGEIVDATGFDESFVHHSMAPYRIRPRVMENVISDMQATAETWASWSRRVAQMWPGASRDEKDQLMEQLEACRRSAGAFIRELKKEARIEGETA